MQQDGADQTSSSACSLEARRLADKKHTKAVGMMQKSLTLFAVSQTRLLLERTDLNLSCRMLIWTIWQGVVQCRGMVVQLGIEFYGTYRI